MTDYMLPIITGTALTTGDILQWNGSAWVNIGNPTLTGLTLSGGFYPRVLNQADEPAAGTGATQCDTGELVVWTDTDDAKCYFCYNHSGTVKTVELT